MLPLLKLVIWEHLRFLPAQAKAWSYVSS